MSADVTPPFVLGATLPSAVVLEGDWLRGPDFVEFKGPGTGVLTVTNRASNVYARFSSATGAQVVGVREDGPPLDRDYCGGDCAEDPDRGASVKVGGDREYHVVRREESEVHELTFEIERPGLRIHSFRFE